MSSATAPLRQKGGEQETGTLPEEEAPHSRLLEDSDSEGKAPPSRSRAAARSNPTAILDQALKAKRKAEAVGRGPAGRPGCAKGESQPGLRAGWRGPQEVSPRSGSWLALLSRHPGPPSRGSWVHMRTVTPEPPLWHHRPKKPEKELGSRKAGERALSTEHTGLRSYVACRHCLEQTLDWLS